MKGWHFLGAERKLGYRDGRIPVIGVPLSASGPIKMCANGMHCSEELWDALQYAPGAIVCRVDLTEEIQKDSDKIVGRTRVIEWMFDATDVLWEFSFAVATAALNSLDGFEELKRICFKAIRIKYLFLRGKVSLSEATEAYSVVRLAAKGLAPLALQESAADSAVYYVADMPATRAALHVANSATNSIAKEKQNTLLTDMIMNCGIS